MGVYNTESRRRWLERGASIRSFTVHFTPASNWDFLVLCITVCLECPKRGSLNILYFFPSTPCASEFISELSYWQIYPWHVFFNVCLHLRSFPFRADWRKSDSSVDREPQGNWRWNSNSRDVVASSPSFSRPATRAPRITCLQAF